MSKQWVMNAALAVLVGGSARAQVRNGSFTPAVESMDRGYSSISYWTYRDDGVEVGGGRISVEHGKPGWPDALDSKEAFDAATVEKLWRLGNNKWSTLDTNLTLHIADRTLPPGIYYLLIARPSPDDWRLAFVAPSAVRPGLIDAWAAQARPDEVPVLFTVPLRYSSPSRRQELDLTLGLDEADMAKGFLRIDWGPHRLETEFGIEMVSPTFYRQTSGEESRRDRR